MKGRKDVSLGAMTVAPRKWKSTLLLTDRICREKNGVAIIEPATVPKVVFGASQWIKRLARFDWTTDSHLSQSSKWSSLVKIHDRKKKQH